jgi:hypothetical protein
MVFTNKIKRMITGIPNVDFMMIDTTIYWMIMDYGNNSIERHCDIEPVSVLNVSFVTNQQYPIL